MELSYNQETETLTLRKGKKVLMHKSGRATALAFVAQEMGRHTTLYQKLAEGVAPEVIKEARHIQEDMISMESQK